MEIWLPYQGKGKAKDKETGLWSLYMFVSGLRTQRVLNQSWKKGVGRHVPGAIDSSQIGADYSGFPWGIAACGGRFRVSLVLDQ